MYLLVREPFTPVRSVKRIHSNFTITSDGLIGDYTTTAEVLPPLDLTYGSLLTRRVVELSVSILQDKW